MLNKNKSFPINKIPYIIAEVANAADGSVEANYELIEAAKKAGADAVKLQFYKYDELAVPSYSKYEIYKRTFYSAEQRADFVDRAKQLGLDVWVDIFDRWGFEVASKNRDKLYAIKIPPTIVLDSDMVRSILRLGLPVAVGVGGYEDEDIDFILSRLDGFDNPILLIYGFQGFPTKIEDTSLARIKHLSDKYGYVVGFADHVDAESIFALRLPEYAFFAGAGLIEKHIIMDRSTKGLDYYSSLEPNEFRQLVDNLNQCAKMYGTVQITAGQKDYLAHATRITTTRPVKSGEIFFQKEIKFRRTDNTDHLLPIEANNFFPAAALHDIDADTGVSKRDIRKAVAGVIVVCRLNSKRLPRKAILDLNGTPAIERCLLNTLASELSNVTILATSTSKEDNELEQYTLKGQVKFFQGSPDDPAARMLEAAELYGIDFIIRVTGDSPLISYELMDYLLESHFSAGADYSSLVDVPLGTGPEVINSQAIKRLKSLTNTDRYSEYLTLYFKNNPDYFTINQVSAPEKYRFPDYRLNLDYPQDYELQKIIFEKLDVTHKAVSLDNVIDFLKANPEIAAINADIKPKYKDGEFGEFINKITKINQS
jgi:N,N'-diacetyllegionaminate synthase